MHLSFTNYQTAMIRTFILLLCLCGLADTIDLAAQPKNNMVMSNGARVDVPYTVVDKASLRVSYALNADNLEDLSTYIDLQYLEVGSQISKYYSAFLSWSDSISAEWMKANPGQGRPFWRGEGGKKPDCWSEYQYCEIFRSGSEQTTYCRMPSYMSNSDCWYTEPYPQQQWQLLADTLTICGQLCQKATCHFRGRDFEAWFAPQIPVGQGPWTFGGLPGLILKLQDADSLYVFECVRIEQGHFPIRKYDIDGYKQMPRDKVLKLQRKFNEDYFRVINARDMETGKPLSIYKPYEPLELE